MPKPDTFTPREYAARATAVIFLSAGTRIGGRRIPTNDAERAQAPVYWSGWEAITLSTPCALQITIDPAGLEEIAMRAARSKGRKAKQGPITVKALR